MYRITHNFTGNSVVVDGLYLVQKWFYEHGVNRDHYTVARV